MIERHLERAADLPSRMLRVVLEEEGRHPSTGTVEELQTAVWPSIERTGVRLAIENHFDIPSESLADAIRDYPPERVGFCVDTANSLRNFEPPARVMELLGPRTLCYHLKDFTVDGHLLGFKVEGAPLGRGRLDVDTSSAPSSHTLTIR